MATREPMQRRRDILPHIESPFVKVANALFDQVKIVQVCIVDIEGCQFRCQQSSGNAPVDLVREEGDAEMVNLLMDKASWLHESASKDSSGPRVSMDIYIL